MEASLKTRFCYELIAAIALLVMAILAPIGLMRLQASASVASVTQGIYLFGAVALFDLVAAWGLQKIFQGNQKSLAAAQFWLRIIYAVGLCVLLVLYLSEIQNANSQSGLAATYRSFDTKWVAWLGIFGMHLIVLGIAIWRSGFLSKIIGALVILSGVGYMIDALIKLISPQTQFAISQFTFIGEALLIFWLPISGWLAWRRSRAK
jgi:hypothetical protein